MMTTTNITERDDLIWLAGLLEGEGCFDLHRGKYPRVRVAMTDRDVVGRAATLLGCSVRVTLRSRPNKSTWHASISGVRAAELMRVLLPHMGTRRSQKIADILGEYEAVRSRGLAFGPSIARPGPALSQPPGY